MTIFTITEGKTSENSYVSNKITAPDFAPAFTIYIKNLDEANVLRWKVLHAAVPSEDADWLEEKSETTLAADTIATYEVSNMRGCLDVQVASNTPDTPADYSIWAVFTK